MHDVDAVLDRVIHAEEPSSDGRRARSQMSRSKIVRATMELLVDGDSNPSIANIAKQAGVGLRSVFRHFEDKDAIFRAIDKILMDAYRPILQAPFVSDVWTEQLMELIERRCQVNEVTSPYRVATTAARRRSKFLKENYRRLYAEEKRQLNSLLPEHAQTDTATGRAILVATSFDTWRFLTQDEEISSQAVVDAIKQLVNDIIKRIAQ